MSEETGSVFGGVLCRLLCESNTDGVALSWCVAQTGNPLPLEVNDPTQISPALGVKLGAIRENKLGCILTEVCSGCGWWSVCAVSTGGWGLAFVSTSVRQGPGEVCNSQEWFSPLCGWQGVYVRVDIRWWLWNLWWRWWWTWLGSEVASSLNPTHLQPYGQQIVAAIVRCTYTHQGRPYPRDNDQCVWCVFPASPHTNTQHMATVSATASTEPAPPSIIIHVLGTVSDFMLSQILDSQVKSNQTVLSFMQIRTGACV